LREGAQHAAGAGHHERRGHPLARGVPHYHSQSVLGEEVEVIEVPSHLPWDDLDLEAGTLQVRRTLSEPKGGYIFEPPRVARAAPYDALRRR
jgi:hypothetical protein